MSLMPSRGAAGAAPYTPDILAQPRTELPRVDPELSFSTMLMGLNPIKMVPKEGGPAPLPPERLAPSPRPQGAGQPSAHAETAGTAGKSSGQHSPQPSTQSGAPSSPQPGHPPEHHGAHTQNAESGNPVLPPKGAAGKSASHKPTGTGKPPTATTAAPSAPSNLDTLKAKVDAASTADARSDETVAPADKDTAPTSAEGGLPLSSCGLLIGPEFQAWRTLTGPAAKDTAAQGSATEGQSATLAASTVQSDIASAQRSLAAFEGRAEAGNMPGQPFDADATPSLSEATAHRSAGPASGAAMMETEVQDLATNGASIAWRTDTGSAPELAQPSAPQSHSDNAPKPDADPPSEALASTLAALLGRNELVRPGTQGAATRTDTKPQIGQGMAALSTVDPRDVQAESMPMPGDTIPGGPTAPRHGGANTESGAFQALLSASSQIAGQALGTDTADELAPRQLNLPTPLNSPDFASDMSARLSLLAREGVQEARLHLNPAEMGPVSVQIVVDGQQAQVHFQADMAQTREVLQNSLPELAAALRDNGLTLSGGGVSSQSRNTSQQGERGNNNGRQERRTGIETVGGIELNTSLSTPRRVSQGVLDLFA